MTPKDIKRCFEDIFETLDGKVSSIDTVYELSDNEKYYKVVISLHNLLIEETLIIHTKFIFKLDLDKKETIEDAFIYLYDINCIYHKVEFKGYDNLKLCIEKVLKSDDFGEDLKILSDFIESPATHINDFFQKNGIVDYSIFDVKYDPKIKTVPCNKTTFDFEFNVKNNYTVSLSISKKEIEEEKKYKLYFKFLDKHKSIMINSLDNLENVIGSNIIELIK